MSNDVNEHGLTRYIPADVRRTIRESCGFGCVFCGIAIVEYEHVDPEFKDATTHDPEKMALLCPGCHGRVTRKTVSKAAVKQARDNPWCIEHGFSYDKLELPVGPARIHIGDSTIENVPIIFSIDGENILGFLPPEANGAEPRLSACFYDTEGSHIADIVNNEYRGIITEADIELIGSTIRIGFPHEPKSLLIEREGGSDIRILEMNLFYRQRQIQVKRNGEIEVTFPNGLKVGLKACSMSNCHCVFPL